ncbi:MAG: helix-turn-helix domain-containing protein [Lachnospiraceae bacterium]|nr:helix-turn-helix domain-containing protein [Lachnospiraceae bacterium]
MQIRKEVDRAMAKDTEMLWKISDKLIAAREKAGMTQEQLAEAIDVQPNSIHRYEAGAREMGFATAIKIAQALHTSVEDLVPDDFLEKKVQEVPAEELLSLFYQMDEADQKAMMRQMMALVFMEKSA